MLSAEISDLLREMIVVILKMSTPVLLAALVVGILISLVQALIQVQEQTLTFVPKLLAVFASLIFFSGYISDSLLYFSQFIFAKITKLS